MRDTRVLWILALSLLACGGSDAVPVSPPSAELPAPSPVASPPPSAAEASVPAPTEAPAPWSVPPRVGVGLGDDHGCRLGDDGKVRCWGRNNAGQLGQGDKEPHPDPVVVSSLSDVARLTVTRYGSCALSRAGEVRCWGVNFASTPELVTLPEPVADVISGGLELCFHLRSGKLVCANRYDAKDERARRELSLPGTPMASGDDHVCSVSEGHVFCTGENRHGQLGIGRGRSSAAAGDEVLGLSDAVEVFAGADGTCATNAEGKLWCWGALPNGEWSSPHPVVVPPVRSLAIGRHHVCVVSRTGELWCWGENRVGQLGDGTNQESAVPVRVRGLDDVQAVAVANEFSCATRRDGSMWCWGDNRDGRLASREVRESTRPVRIDGLAAASAIAVRDEAGCAVVRGGGMRCWGDNSDGLFDDGSVEPRLQPVASLHLRDMQRISLSRHHGCGVDTAGAAWCWGQPDERLGVGLHTPKRVRLTRTQLLVALQRAAQAQQDPQHEQKMLQANIAARAPRQLKSPTNLEQVGTGLMRSCARDAKGRVWCWGQAPSGDGSRLARARPVRIPGLLPAKDLAVGADYACALEQGGTVACWGGNHSGQLGDGKRNPRLAPSRVVGLDDAIAVAAGARHTCARRRDGHAVCWGANDHGQLGMGAVSELGATPVAVKQLDHVALLSAGEDHTCAVDQQGKPWCWGLNTRGQLGLGHSRDVAEPQPIDGLDDVTAIAAGPELTCALRGDGSVWCWGAFLPPLRGAWSPIPTRL